MNKLNALAASAVLASLTAAAAHAAPVAPQPSKDKCYGISLAGKNDCRPAPARAAPGRRTRNYQGNAWKYVARGTCASIKTPKGLGSLTPIKR